MAVSLRVVGDIVPIAFRILFQTVGNDLFTGGNQPVHVSLFRLLGGKISLREIGAFVDAVAPAERIRDESFDVAFQALRIFVDDAAQMFVEIVERFDVLEFRAAEIALFFVLEKTVVADGKIIIALPFQTRKRVLFVRHDQPVFFEFFYLLLISEINFIAHILPRALRRSAPVLSKNGDFINEVSSVPVETSFPRESFRIFIVSRIFSFVNSFGKIFVFPLSSARKRRPVFTRSAPYRPRPFAKKRRRACRE